MGNRCQSCSKFVGLELDEPELSIEVQGDNIIGEVSLKLNCVECGDTLKEAQLTVDMPIDHACEDGYEGELGFQLISESAAPTDFFNTTDRHGKPIKSARYQTHLYGAEIQVEVKCDHCNKVIMVEETITEPASNFEESW